MSSTVIERIYEVCSKYKYSQGKLEKELGFSNGYLNTTFQRKGNVGSNIIQIIIGKFPELNLYWLLTGEGSMLREEEQNKKEKITQEREEEQICISCNNKDMLIESLRETISAQKQAIKAQEQAIAFLKLEISELEDLCKRNSKKSNSA